ncbi:MAG TPA: hypothetical protein VF746_16400 [Longimicrobium sp.]|jgi:hypothetical protein
MKKLKLDLDAVSVDSFETSAFARGAGGTVHAHFATRGQQPTCGLDCCQTCVGCPPAPTAEVTCAC